MSLLVCVDAVLEKKLNFDLLTPSPGSGEVGEGGGVGEGKVNNFFRHVGAPHIYWTSLAKR